MIKSIITLKHVAKHSKPILEGKMVVNCKNDEVALYENKSSLKNVYCYRCGTSRKEQKRDPQKCRLHKEKLDFLNE